jgi:hypothetical protein
LRRVQVQTKRVTVPIYGLGCSGGGSLTVERALVKIPGIVRTYVNPAMEMAYVEYDPTRTAPCQWIEPVERVGFRAGVPINCGDVSSDIGPDQQSSRTSSKKHLLAREEQVASTDGRLVGTSWFRSRSTIVLLAFLAIGAFFLVTEHTAHVFGILPYALLLLCPLLHVFMHWGHGGDHATHGDQPNQLHHGGV